MKNYVDLKKELDNTLDEALLYYNELIPLYRFPMCILDAEYNNNGIITLYMEYIIGPDYSDVNMLNEDKKSLRFQNYAKIASAFVTGIQKNMKLFLEVKN